MCSLVTWLEEYSLHYSPIDKQHRQLLDLLNILHSLDTKSLGKEKSSSIIFRLVVFTETHFAYEEKLLDLVGFPDMSRHKAYHEVMKFKTREIVKEYMKKDTFDKEDVLFFLRDWWVNHILIEDMKYKPLLVSHGLTENDDL